VKTIITYLALLVINFCYSQDIGQLNTSDISTVFLRSFSMDADTFIGVDDFENYYYLKNNTLYKKTSQKTYSYTNTQFGKITSVDITNPLKILLFYRDFNTFLFVDNQLNELTSAFNFTTTAFSKNITFVSVSSNNNLWLYSQDDTVLQLWNHQTKKIQFTSQPLSFYVHDFKAVEQLSSYKECWLIDKNNLLKFNEYGTFLEAVKIDGYTQLKPFENKYTYIKNKKLFYQDTVIPLLTIDKTKVTVKNYSIQTNRIYIFDGTKIFVFKIIKNK